MIGAATLPDNGSHSRRKHIERGARRGGRLRAHYGTHSAVTRHNEEGPRLLSTASSRPAPPRSPSPRYTSPGLSCSPRLMLPFSSLPACLALPSPVPSLSRPTSHLNISFLASFPPYSVVHSPPFPFSLILFNPASSACPCLPCPFIPRHSSSSPLHLYPVLTHPAPPYPLPPCFNPPCHTPFYPVSLNLHSSTCTLLHLSNHHPASASFHLSPCPALPCHCLVSVHHAPQ